MLFIKQSALSLLLNSVSSLVLWGFIVKLRFLYCLPILTLFLSCQTALANPTELSLKDSIGLAFKNNPVLQIAHARQEQSAWSVREAKSANGLAVKYTHLDRRSTEPLSWMPSLEAISPGNYFSNKLTASLPLYTGGKIENIIKQADLGLTISELEITATKQRLKLEASMGYYGVLQSQTLLEVAKQTVDDFTAHLKRVQKMYDTGVVPWHDVLQTKVRLANAENNLVKAQNSYDLAVYSLNKTIGLPLRSELKLVEPLAYAPYTITLEEVISFGLSKRTEILQTNANVSIQEAQEQVARSEQRPSVALVGSMTWQDTDFAGTNNRNWTAMMITEFNVFNSGNTQAKIKQAQAGITAAKEQVRQVQDNISLEISDAFLSLKEAEKRIATNKVAVEEASVNYTIAQKRYSAGVGTNLDVMDAELAMNQAKTNYVNSLHDYNASKARLDKAIGANI